MGSGSTVTLSTCTLSANSAAVSSDTPCIWQQDSSLRLS